MKAIKKGIKQSSSIHQKIKKASFVSLEPHDTEKFKYNILFRTGKYINDKFVALKTIYKRTVKAGQLYTQKVDFKKIGEDVSTWIIESLIEGFGVNFVVWALMGWKFNLITILAWGFAIKQLLSIYWRLRKHGTNSTIFKKDK